MFFIKLKNNLKKLLIMSLFLQGYSFLVVASDFDQNSLSLITPSPAKQTYIYSDGYSELESQNLPKKVRVQLYISLGSPFIAAISDIIKKSDQFSLSFMYRFNSPILLESFRNNSHNSVIFLDRNQCYEDKNIKKSYNGFVTELIQKVPTSLIDLKSKSFHQKIIICKNSNEQAYTMIGSANATVDAENRHSEEIFFIQSNELAKIYIEEFYKLFNSSKRHKQEKPEERLINIYHENLIKGHTSNTEYLSECLSFLKKDKSKLNENFGIEAAISSLAISTGFVGGKSHCLNLVNEVILNDPQNEVLVFLQNYMNTLDETFQKKIKDPNVNKIIIMDDNEHNKSIFEQLKSYSLPNILPIMHKTYMNGKFHHKSIIQYKNEGRPIIYIGSFNISKNAVQNNAENIIGVKSKLLPGLFLSTLLRYQSGLCNNINIWNFLSKNIIMIDRNIEYQAKETLNEIKHKYVHYKYLINNATDNLETAINYISYNEGPLPTLITEFENETENNEKLEKLYDLVNFIFKNDWPAKNQPDSSNSVQKAIDLKVEEVINEVNSTIKKFIQFEKNLEVSNSKSEEESSESTTLSNDNYSQSFQEIKYCKLKSPNAPETWLENMHNLIEEIRENIENFKSFEKNEKIDEIIQLLKSQETEVQKVGNTLPQKNKIRASTLKRIKKNTENIINIINLTIKGNENYLLNVGINISTFNKEMPKKDLKNDWELYLIELKKYIAKSKKNLHTKLKNEEINQYIISLKNNVIDIKNIYDILYRINEIPNLFEELVNLENKIIDILPDQS